MSGVATYLVIGLVLIVAGVGGVVVIAQPSILSFGEYVNALKDLAVGVGLLGVGRGIALGLGR